jgi:hypothetical protein
MRFRMLEDLVALGLLEPKPPDPARVGRWLERSRSDLALSRDVLAQLDRDRAMAVAYEAGYRACAGMLALAGYRVTSQPGHHRAAIDGAGAVLGPSARPLLRRLDAARRFRNETLYGDAPPAPEGELRQLVEDVGSLLDGLVDALSAPYPGPG